MCDVDETPNLATLADTSDGEGVEVWISFAEKEDMTFFERGFELLAFASLNSSPLIQQTKRCPQFISTGADFILTPVITKETVTPSSPTSPHLRTFKLSLLDQLTPFHYVNLLLFFTTNPNTAGVGGSGKKNKKRTETSQRLKKSLSETLTRFYPLAGRMKTHASSVVDCNDEGVPYSVAQVINHSLTNLLQQPDSEELAHFIPAIPHETEEEEPLSSPPPLVHVQVTFFEKCDGMVLGMSISHKVADAATIAAFTKAWANATILGSPDAVVPIFKAASLFPPIHPCPIRLPSIKKKNLYNARRLVFHATKIAALRAKAASTSVQRPTRVEAISALIWKCALKASRLRLGEPPRKPSVWQWPVNVRPRLVPPLSEHSFGNLFVVSAAQDDGTSETNDLSGFVCHLRKQSLIMGNKFNQLKEDNGEQNDMVIFDVLVELAKRGCLSYPPNPSTYTCTSRCKFGFYDIDFGFGKPTWVKMGDARQTPNVVLLADTGDGEGVEAWVSFAEKEDMAFFERDSELLAYASLNPSPLQ
ncbi:hypothetical protein Vadar_027347 [Vaccinium darrowii]|uniref:Uncharacterized protein n=1 Tax=Vaccinium darrowii TaxID=229202 RepID=A0ACB7XCL5_9ERIC|nr:hypothetical protein Vadar_027347 [Vaccinium darrowii]